VDVKGFDAQVGRRFGDWMALAVSASYNDSELQGSLDPALDGKQLVETPEWTFGARMDLTFLEDLRAGLQAKYVGDRYATDNNDEKAAGYTVVDLDASYSFHVRGFQNAQVQLNVTNLLDEEYFGSISSGTGGSSVGFYYIGAPRTVVASLRFDF
jgi:iron complex outermembrane receptor protein